MKSVLLVDDDRVYRERLALSFQRRGYEVHATGSSAEAMTLLQTVVIDAAVVDLKMPGESGLTLVDYLRRESPDCVTLVLTGYGSIATAVEAIRLGASDYMTKPADADQIEQALLAGGRSHSGDMENDHAVPSLDRVEWEHMQRVLQDCGGNISQAARMLGIERRSLQRKLHKHPPAR